MSLNHLCSVCQSHDTTELYSLSQVPTQDGRLSETLKEAKSSPIGNIDLVYCYSCGYVENVSYDRGKTNFDSYDFSVFHSPSFASYLDRIVSRLVKKHHIYNKTILEVGSGDGYFLKSLCLLGDNDGIGIDPGFELKAEKHSTFSVNFIREYYSEKHQDLRPDFLFCRHVLNAVPDPIGFLKTIRKNLKNTPDCVLYFEVPNAHYTFGEKVVWNVVYEHKSWFAPASLVHIFEHCGFEVLDVVPCWKDEFLAIEVRLAQAAFKVDAVFKKDLVLFSNEVQSFQNSVEKITEENRKRVATIGTKSVKVVMWGAGARGLAFLNMYPVDKTIQYVVDINPLRHGKFMPGSGHTVISPEELSAIKPDLIIINNPTYELEIKNHASRLGLHAEFWVLN
ncbi:MAG: class I SAM-dependent methyltransferase [Bacteroidia bacterium]|nr:class I SAM-dependent methyltransferase [Bacteroidia bacterium]